MTEGGPVDAAADHETGLVRFLAPHLRPRWRELVASGSRRKRSKLLDRLNHGEAMIDPAHAIPVPSLERDEGIAWTLAELRRRGAPASCRVVCAASALDARDMDLEEALEAVHGRRTGALLSCVPGRLGYYESEDGTRLVLFRAGAG